MARRGGVSPPRAVGAETADVPAGTRTDAVAPPPVGAETAPLPQRRSIRLRGYDYAQAGAYFVTVCTQGRYLLFGEVSDGEMRLNELGELAAKWVQDIPDHFPDADMDVFVIMPNHMHGIVVIGDHRPDPPHPSDTRRGGVAPPPTGAGTAPLRPTLGQVVAYFKYQSAKQINVWRQTPGATTWQRNYYEHIIRNEDSLERIRNYIATNPLRWAADRENPAATSSDDFDRWLDAQGEIPVRGKSRDTRR